MLAEVGARLLVMLAALWLAELDLICLAARFLELADILKSEYPLSECLESFLCVSTNASILIIPATASKNSRRWVEWVAALDEAEVRRLADGL